MGHGTALLTSSSTQRHPASRTVTVTTMRANLRQPNSQLVDITLTPAAILIAPRGPGASRAATHSIPRNTIASITVARRLPLLP